MSLLQLPDFPVVSRLAPTPSGFLHLGNAINFTLTWLLTRSTGGTLHLRIDDLDRARFRPAYLDNIFQTLDWLGLDYDQGPSGPDDFDRNFSQRHFLTEYEATLQAAYQAHPDVFYACGCSRTQLASFGSLYPGTCRLHELPIATPNTAWRVHVPKETKVGLQDLLQGVITMNLATELGDFVVRKKDGIAAYQVASILDDVRLGTTLIVRGLDLLSSSAAQVWLAHYLPGQAGFRKAHFVHHGLAMDSLGRKISKSTQTSVQQGIVAQAVSPKMVYRAVAQQLNLPSTSGESLASLASAVSVGFIR